MKGSLESQYRVTNADGSSPSCVFEKQERAEETFKNRSDMWPELGPQKIQKRIIAKQDWEDYAPR